MADGGDGGGGGGGGAKAADSPAPADGSAEVEQSRAQALAAHGHMLYRASMDEEHLDLPVTVAEDTGYITDKRVNNVCPRKKDDDEEATHAWSIPPVDTFHVRASVSQGWSLVRAVACSLSLSLDLLIS